MSSDDEPEDGHIVGAFYVTNPRAVQVGVSEAARGQLDGRPMVFITTPVETMPMLMDPDIATLLAERLQAAAKLTTEKRAELWG